MDTTKLRSFATTARTQLIAEVTARLQVALAPSSSARVESPETIRALERAIREHGDGSAGRNLVAEQVAYTWFNRIIALRFMDTNGYTGAGVVSPQRGFETGQPEILADAKRGHFDTNVVDARIIDSVTGLLNGIRKSSDPQGEAYGQLLTAHCRRWNKSMPFMFQTKGDYTELLMPADLLAEGSVLSKAVRTLTKVDCANVEVIGWLYQFYISERKGEVFAGFQKKMKAGASEIPAATQLFTPDWIVRYLVENSLGRLWMLNRPNSNLIDRMEYFIKPVEDETDFLEIGTPEDLKIIDPACGSGHMLTYAFDLLYAIYEEEGYAPSAIPSLILANNLYGCEIDERAGSLAAFALTMKARSRQRSFLTNSVTPNICVLQPIRFGQNELDELATSDGNRESETAFWNQFENSDVFGSLIRPKQELVSKLSAHLDSLGEATTLFGGETFDRAHVVVRQAEFLSTKYHAVVANPPYMGSGNMGPDLAEWVLQNFPDTKSGLDGAFIERGLELAVDSGYLAMITMQSWMFLSRYENFRRRLLMENRLANMLYLGTGVFPEIPGEKVDNVAFVVKSGVPAVGRKADFIDLSGTPKALKSQSFGSAHQTYTRSTDDLASIPGFPLCFWASSRMVTILKSSRTLSDYADIRVGLDSGNNSQFIREWHEVENGKIGFGHSSKESLWSTQSKWVPHTKGGEYRKWYGNLSQVLAFDESSYSSLSQQGNKLPSRDFYFRESLCYTRVSSSDLSVRVSPQGAVFNSASPSIFSTPQQSLALAGLLNSSALQSILECISPTLNYQAGELRRIPIAEELFSEKMNRLVEKLIQAHRDDWDESEQSWDFKDLPLVQKRSSAESLDEIIHLQAREWAERYEHVKVMEREVNSLIIDAYGLEEKEEESPETQITLTRKPGSSAAASKAIVEDLISYAVGCIFGRYSLDTPGMISTDATSWLATHSEDGPSPSFLPDADNVLPILADSWFEDDMAQRFRAFLKVSFGKEHFEENLRSIENALGKDIRKYFVQDFYKEHLRRYRKRPIYWMFSSPKGSFNALIYMHRYTPSTVGTVLNDYLREFQAKLQGELQKQELLSVATDASPRDKTKASKEVERIRKVLLELDEYEHDVLYPLASRQIGIDLDDGVLVNYLRFGRALYRVPEIEKKRAEVETWDWLSKPLEPFDGGSK